MYSLISDHSIIHLCYNDLKNFCSVTKLKLQSPTLCNHMDCNRQGFPLFHHLLELVQTPVHWVDDAFNHIMFCLPFYCPQSLPASGSFSMSWIFASGCQSIRASALVSLLPVNIQDWFSLGWTGWISLQSQGTLKSLLQNHSSKASILWCSTLLWFTSHLRTWLLEKTIALSVWTFVSKVMFLLF